MSEEFESKSSIMGFGNDEVNCAKFLGREIRLHDYGISCRGDHKHSEVLLDEWAMTDLKAVVSPGCTEEKEEASDVEVS